MGKSLKKWKWPIGAAGAVVLVLGVQAVRSSPAYDTALAAKQSNTATSIDIANESGQDGAGQWYDRHERRGRPGSGGTFERSNGGGSSSGIDGGSSGDTGGQFGQAPNSGSGGRSSTRVS